MKSPKTTAVAATAIAVILPTTIMAQTSGGRVGQEKSYPDIIAGMGHGPGNANRVRISDARGNLTTVDFLAYAGGQMGVNVAGGQLDGAGRAEIVTGPGPGATYGPQVRGFVNDGSAIAQVNFYASGTLKYGINVATGQLDGGASHEILTGAGPGQAFGPQVRGWSTGSTSGSLTITPMAKINYFAYDTVRYGAGIASGDVDADGYSEIVTTPGPGPHFGPQVRGFDFDGNVLRSMGKINFNAFQTTGFSGQARVGDVDADGFGEILAAPGPCQAFSAEFLAFDFDGSAVQQVADFYVDLGIPLAYGGRMGVADVKLEGRDQLLAAPGPGPAAPALVEAWQYPSGKPFLLLSFTPFASAYGVELASGILGF
ncbi:MAG: hypothetical protein U0166_15320 [Acidobacteriota bacterium]